MQRRKNGTSSNVYHQKFSFFMIAIPIASIFAIHAFYTKYSETGSTFYMILTSLFLLISIFFIKPIIEWRRIEIDDTFITVHKLFFKPTKMDISKSIYQVVVKKEDIRSYRFRHGKINVQISPEIYRNGQELSEKIIDHIKRKNLVVDIV